MPMQIHTTESIAEVTSRAFDAARAIASEAGVALVVVVVDARERVHYQTEMGPTMTAGALARAAGLFDCTQPPPPPVVVGACTVPGCACGGINPASGHFPRGHFPPGGGSLATAVGPGGGRGSGTIGGGSSTSSASSAPVGGGSGGSGGSTGGAE